MLWTTDEETGSKTSRALLETEARTERRGARARAGAAGRRAQDQPQGVRRIRARRARQSPRTPASIPGKGVSAIRELARQILAIETLQDLERGVSVNVGVIDGGTRPNVVAERSPGARRRARADAGRRRSHRSRRCAR